MEHEAFLWSGPLCKMLYRKSEKAAWRRGMQRFHIADPQPAGRVCALQFSDPMNDRASLCRHYLFAGDLPSIERQSCLLVILSVVISLMLSVPANI